MSEWQPIATAPTDGKPFLAWDGSQRDSNHMPHYETGECVSFDDPRFAICYFRTFYGETQLAWGKPWGNRNAAHPTPTHWMPLPEPPKETA